MGFRGKHKNKRDGNEKDIVNKFRSLGATVDRLDQPVDLLVGYEGETHLVEVKQEGERLNDKQKAWAEAWSGDLVIVRSLEDVLDTVDRWKTSTVPMRGRIG